MSTALIREAADVAEAVFWRSVCKQLEGESRTQPPEFWVNFNQQCRIAVADWILLQ